MSPDDVFAGQMWAWPEPVIKRDSFGRVLFVNAAFLQMYGGTIEAWRGNVVQGWANPQPQGHSYRFETRLPTEYGEQVYDWVEYSMPDGAALTLARNVSHFITPADPPPGYQEPVPAQAPMAEQPAQAGNVQAQMPAAAAVGQAQNYQQNQEATQAPTEYVNPAETISEAQPATAAPADTEHHTPLSYHAEPLDVTAPPVAAAEQTQPAAPVYEAPPAPIAEAPAQRAPEIPPSAPPPAVEQSAAPAPQATETRDFERRALPIEDGDAVLGNNWRDAVIAKAVGVDQEELADRQEEAKAAEADTTAQNDSDTGGQVRILLAEDNAINALLTRTLLEAEGCFVDTVEDGVLAVEAMKNASYDLIFMDMRMPNMDGLEATRKIRALPNVPQGLPIIALTANAFDDDRNACFDSGMNDFMTKPVSAEELTEMVNNWTSRGAQTQIAS